MTDTELRLAAVRAEREALRIQLEQEREAHKATKAQLAALAAEHKEAAKVAEERIRRLTGLLSDAVSAMAEWGAEEDGVPEDGRIGKAFDAARAALVQVQR